MKSLSDELESQSDEANLTPMIDCVFLLLLFFIVTSTFSEESSVFNIELPTASQSKVKELSHLATVQVSLDGKFSMSGEVHKAESLYQLLKKLHSKSKIEALIIKGDRRTPYEHVVTVMDIGQAVGIENISLAVIKQ